DYITHRFSDPETIIDRVHALFEQWVADGTFEPGFDGMALHRVRLAVHEWLANLLQHADFADRTPDVSLRVRAEEREIHCVIDDNSEGFDLDGLLTARREILDAF